MKNRYVFLGILLLLGSAKVCAQNNWKTNLNNGTFGHKFGTSSNYPVDFFTNNTERMKINQIGTNYMGIPTSGYIGMGLDPTDIRSRLTITGANNTIYGGGGYRSWMKTGIFNLENSDNMYVGMKAEGFNRSDAVIDFGDDNSGTAFNNFRILFTAPGLPKDDFLEIARYTATGNIGFGPVFTNATQPASLLHLNRDKKKSVWFQITNQNGTGQSSKDGLRLGIRQGNNASAYLRWQENTPFIVQTDWNNTAGGINAGERMRVTSIGSAGVPQPAGASGKNITRVAISENGSQPITQPRSLLHLGYNTGLNSFPQGSADG